MTARSADEPFKLSLGHSNTKSVLPAKRTRVALTEDSDHEDERPKQEHILGFENGNSVTTASHGLTPLTRPNQPLVIPVQKDAAWRNPTSLRKRGANLLPPEARAQQKNELKETDNTQDAETQQYGLIISAQARDASAGPGEGNEKSEKPTSRSSLKQTLEEEAYARLISGEERSSALVIPDAGSGDTAWVGRDEPDGFKADVASRPEPSTMADYESVPIEEFGAAMLRGMGWKDGEGIGRGVKGKNPVQPRTLERRPNLLGIGAKSAPEGLEEFGAWGGKGTTDGSKIQRGPKTRAVYNPLVMRNKATGEIATEGEIQERQSEQHSEQAARKKATQEPLSRDGNSHRRTDSTRRQDKDRYRDRDKATDRRDWLRNSEDRNGGTGDRRPRDRKTRRDDSRQRERRGHSRSISPGIETRGRHSDESRRRREEYAYYRTKSRSRSPRRRERSKDRQNAGRQRHQEQRGYEHHYRSRDRG